MEIRISSSVNPGQLAPKVSRMPNGSDLDETQITLIEVFLNAATTLTVSALIPGQFVRVRLLQDAVGGWGVTWAGATFDGDPALLVPALGAGVATDVVFIVRSSTTVEILALGSSSSSSSSGSAAAIVGESQPGASAEGWTSGTAYFESSNLFDFKPTRTLVIISRNPAAVIGGNTLLGCGDGALFTLRKGWTLTALGGGPYWSVLGGGLDASQVGLGPVANPYQVQVCAYRWQTADNHVKFTLNGGPIEDNGQAAVPGLPVDGTCRTRVGASIPGDSPRSFPGGGILAFALLDAELSDAELIAATAYGVRNRLVLPPGVSGDPRALIVWEAINDWDGVSATTKTRGTTPVTLTRVGSLWAVDVSEVRVPLNTETVQDSVTNVQGVGYIARDQFGRVRVVTDSTTLAVDIFGNGGTPVVGVYVNGAYNASPSSPFGVPVPLTNTNNAVDVPLPAGAQKTVDLSFGQEAAGTYPLGMSGGYINALRLRTSEASRIVSKVPPVNRFVVVGDSIFSGYNCGTAQQEAFQMGLRYSLARAGVASFAWSGQVWKLITDGSQLSSGALIALLVQLLDGTGTNRIAFETITNDYAGNYATPAAHAVSLETVLAGLEAAGIVNLLSYVWGGTQRIAPANEAANGLGFTLQDYRDVRQAVALTNPTKRIYIPGNTVVSNANMAADGVHLTPAANAQLKTFWQSTLAFT